MGKNILEYWTYIFLAVIGITFISSLIFVTLILGAVYSIEKIGQKRLEKQFDNDEE